MVDETCLCMVVCIVHQSLLHCMLRHACAPWCVLYGKACRTVHCVLKSFAACWSIPDMLNYSCIPADLLPQPICFLHPCLPLPSPSTLDPTCTMTYIQATAPNSNPAPSTNLLPSPPPPTFTLVTLHLILPQPTCTSFINSD